MADQQIVKQGNHFVGASQASNIPLGLSHSIIQIPSTSSPAFNSSFLFDIRNKGVKLHQLILALTPSAITGISGAPTNYPCFIPASLWIDHVETIINGVVYNTQYGLELFLRNQMFNSDEMRLVSNAGEGDYLSVATRNSLTTFYVTLKSLFDESHFPVLRTTDEIQIKVYLKPVTSIVSQSTGTGTPVATLNTASLIVRHTQLDTNSIQQQMAFIMKTPKSYFFHSTKYGTYNVPSGITSTTQVLSQLAGSVSILFFVVRPTASTTGESTFSFTDIASFNILDNAGNSMVGGSVIPSRLNQALVKNWTQSTYISEFSRAVSNSYVFMWAFTPSPVDSFKTGSRYGCKQFMGQEQLVIQWASATGAANTIDVFSFNYAGIVMGPAGCTLSN